MTRATDLPKYRYSACAFSFLLFIGWPHTAQAACTFTPTAGNDTHLCDSGTGGPLSDLAGDNTLNLPANGTGTINGNVTFGAGIDTVNMDSGQIVGTVDQGDGADVFNISAGQVTGAVNQGNGIDNFTMTGGTIQSLAQGDNRDFFLMTGGTIVGAFEDGDTARMTGGTIGRVDMKLDNNLFDLSGGQIIGNLVTGFGTDTIIVSGGRIGGNISVSGGNDSITVTGGEIVGEIRASAGNDTFLWDGGGIIRSAILMGDDNDSAIVRNLSETTLALTPSIDGGPGTDQLTFDHTASAGAARYINWETVSLNNGARFDVDGNFVLGDSVSGTGMFNIDGSSVITSTQGSITPFTAGQGATLNNAGIIDLSSGNARTSDTLTVQGNYAGSGGQLWVQSALGGDNSPSDKLVVNDGSLTGSTAITVSNLGGAGAETLQNGIQVVQAQGSAVSSNDAFSLKAPVSAGAFDYVLYKGGVTPGSENSWFLRSSVVAAPLVEVPNPDPTLPPILVPLVAAPVAAAGSPALPTPAPGAAPIPLYRPEVPTWSVLPPAAAQLALNALGTFHDRQGDQRLLTETGTFGAGWGRVYGKNFEQTWAGTVTPKLDGSLNGFQVGNDLFGSQLSGGQTQRTGFFVGHSRLKGDVDGFNQGFEDRRAGKVELEGDSLGAYWTLTDPGNAYIDAVAMYTWLDGDSHSERGLKIDNDGHAVTLSVEAGYPFAVVNDWVVEPQAQMIHQRIELDSQNDGISEVAFDSDPSWIGRLGARLKGRYDVSGLPLEPYLRANLWHTFSGTDTVTFAGTTDIDTEQRSSWADLGIGANLTLAPSISVYANVDYSSNIDSNQQRGVAANVGLRLSW
ncbi:outer membrane autotransporter barrel domain-containing protein [Pseudomonas reinekei]|uniref:Autotransporter outer membrane beta-barrel domain-containing protein n=1 Tax=Pseudomonas reinekei TaxID=395598 RepID=A0A1H0UCS3_PSERE|nr:autotransporter outer membrane beta-barrel domain-containing protein [Pseudomonas reinekei]KAB0487903.1 autotransporter outer membrane beta-barrel domain-containing protein [Pseudomonas reinekei]OLU05339.1 autotransporter outer membrane beta-barrel domain-containing protein [Pseudomonas reinekei]SDP63788.1 outer membrane autotransporter barrel domain-containing protein [Pseudomonas reinekei]